MKNALTLLLALTALACASGAPPGSNRDANRARALHEAALVVDTHADTPSEYIVEPFDLGVRQTKGHFDYPRMIEGGLDAEFLVAYVPARFAGNGAAAYCLKMIETIHRMVELHPSQVALARSTGEIRSVVARDRKAILIGIEGGHAIEDSLDLLRAFHRLGARYMTLTHRNTNNWADSSGDEGKHNGLTSFGKEVVLEMNRLGMMVDISHVSDKTFYDAVEVSKAPVIATHSSAKALANVARNMTDEMLLALARNRGVVMVNFYSGFLNKDVADAAAERGKLIAPAVAELEAKDPGRGKVYRERLKELYTANPIPTIPYTVIVDHIDHIVKVAGIDSVGFGSDYDGVSALPVGLEDVSKLPVITEELLRRGYSDSDIRKILGGNFMRVFAEVEKVGREMQSVKRARSGR